VLFQEAERGRSGMVEALSATDAQKAVCFECLRKNPQTVLANYNSGDDRAWQQEVSAELARQAWDLITPAVKDLLTWKCEGRLRLRFLRLNFSARCGKVLDRERAVVGAAQEITLVLL
jgi:hypothetical protein